MSRDAGQDEKGENRQCKSCQIKSEQICKILKILSQTLVFLEEAKKWQAGRGDRPNDASVSTEWKLRSDVTTLEENISNFLFSFSHDVSFAALGKYTGSSAPLDREYHRRHRDFLLGVRD